MFTFETASEADFERLVGLRTEALRESFERLGRFDPARIRERFRKTFEPRYTRLIQSRGAWCGCVALRPEGDDLWLSHFYLTAATRGAGLGSAVLEHLTGEVDEARKAIRLSVLRESDANRFYVRRGFVETGQDEIDIYYRRPPGG